MIPFDGSLILHLNRLLLGLGAIAGVSLICPVVAAPSVRNFGNTTSSKTFNNTRSSTMKTNQLSSGANKRASSLRVSDSTIKPVTKTASVTKSASVGTTQRGSSVGSSRMSGLRGNVVKEISSKLSSNYTSQPGGSGSNTSNLEQRINSLENQISTKQNVLESGEGINIEHNTISVSQEIASLPETVENLNQEINNLSQQINDATLPANYYTAEQTRAYVQQNYYDKQYIDQGLYNANFMNYFDGDVSTNTTYVLRTDANGNGTWQVLEVQDTWDPEF